MGGGKMGLKKKKKKKKKKGVIAYLGGLSKG